jgi:hypothetical protein
MRPGSFTVVEVVDFQCERCKKRTPEIRPAAGDTSAAHVNWAKKS